MLELENGASRMCLLNIGFLKIQFQLGKVFEAFNNVSCIKKQRMKPETCEALLVDREEINVKRQSLLTDYFEKKKD